MFCTCDVRWHKICHWTTHNVIPV